MPAQLLKAHQLPAAGSMFFPSAHREFVVPPAEGLLGQAARVLGPFMDEEWGLIGMSVLLLLQSGKLCPHQVPGHLLKEFKKILAEQPQQEGAPQELTSLLRKAYRAIKADPVLRSIRRAPTTSRNRRDPFLGHYYYCLPEDGGGGKSPIIFLHGYGGNFLFYVWAMRSGFPDRIVLFPSWGYRWDLGPLCDRLARIEEVQRDFASKADVTIQKPWLFGISQGGVAAFELAAGQPHDSTQFRGLVSLASCPETAPTLPSRFPVLMLNGAFDRMFSSRVAEAMCEAMNRQGADAVFQRLPEDHFFILSAPDRTMREIRAFIEACETA